MKLGIKNKITIILVLFLSALFLLMAQLLVKEKEQELTSDIYENTVAFSKLTAEEIVNNYQNLFLERSYVNFQSAISQTISENPNISHIQIANYQGQRLFSSNQDASTNETTPLPNTQKKHLYTEDISLFTQAGQSIFLDREAFDPNQKINFIAKPATEEFTVFYFLNYNNLDLRILAMKNRIFQLAIFGILLGMLTAFLLSKRITKPLAKLVQASQEIAKGNLDQQVSIKTNDEIEYLGKNFNNMAKELKSSIQAKIYQERVTQELQMATEIQNRLIPDILPKFQNLEVSAGLIPAEEIGGDIYDFISLPNDRTLIYLGDVTGHGVPAGIVSSITSALFYGFSNEKDLITILSKVNKVMKHKIMATMFVTLVLMEWNDQQKTFKYASAGHEQIIHYQAKQDKATLLPAGGLALAMIEDINNNLQTIDVPLEKDDFLIIYSDGIPEMWRNKEENFGMQRLLSTVEQNGKSNPDPEQMKQKILGEVKSFSQGYKQMDDVTIIVLKRT